MKIKRSILFAFLVWMQNGGHGLSNTKKHMAMRKGENFAKIFHSDDDYLDMNDYCQNRYEMFLKQYFNHGKSFIDNLMMDGAREVFKHRKQMALEVMR